ncbi:MAG: hypothetical protein ACFFCW_17655 [Candidatus Hodarchaeota archaeon]
MPSLFGHYPQRPANPICENSYVILCNAHDTSSSFLDSFNTVRRNRNARGTPTDEEQDLLRAMLTFASAGLDSLVKQLIRDALPVVIDSNVGANEMFKSYIERRLKRGEEVDHRLLADVLGDKEPRSRLVQVLISDLTSQSLQSTDQLLRVAAFFDIPSNQLTRDPDNLSQIFRARNQIIHEMDVDFTQSNRNRRPRARQTMARFTNEIFRVSNAFLEEVDSRIAI